eukprot:TRINITY_DN42995_c0_g1_i1.p1 TRINITY_DN42995_c0_g1~~TRINITY_DN42995_c0_g1_i1.p1  ORF type:complete len:267 (+),score=48.14 TRINITY_DN42995_c0_g1_i1:66-866(+)
MAERSRTPTARPGPLRLLCLHGDGGHAQQVCDKLAPFFKKYLGKQTAAVPVGASAAGAPPAADVDAIDVDFRCIDAPFPEPSRRKEGRQWWRYDEGGYGDRPEDWAEMEHASTKLAEALQAPVGDAPYDGVVGFSQGAEMVHTLALLQHRGDPRFLGSHMPRFVVSMSGAVNPGHYEASGAGGPPQGCIGPSYGPYASELGLPCLFLGDFKGDRWYSPRRFQDTLGLYKDVTLLEHSEEHRVPLSLDGGAAAELRRFFARFAGGDR